MESREEREGAPFAYGVSSSSGWLFVGTWTDLEKCGEDRVDFGGFLNVDSELNGGEKDFVTW